MRCDILGLGCATVDDLLYVDAFPGPDEKTIIRRQERQCGGLTATALVAAARFGARCGYAGVLGTDDLSRFVANHLAREGIDLSLSPRLEEARVIHSTIIVDTAHHSRNIFFVPGVHVGAHPALPAEEDIRSAGAIFVDHYGAEGTVRSIKIARHAGVPVVADLERANLPCFDEILGLVDHLVVSEGFALRITSAGDPAEAARRLLTPGRSAVVVTGGERGCWAVSHEDRRPAHFPAFAVPVVDTTGCGDVFHGVYAATLVQGMPLGERIRYGAAAAALKALQSGAQHGIPTRDAIDRFLAEH